MRYFKDGNGNLITMYNVVKMYLEFKERGDVDEDFRSYLNDCTSKNGSLTEVAKEDARDVRVETVYYTGNAQHMGNAYWEKVFYLKETIPNAKEVNWDGVNNVIVDEDENRIFQAGGYNKDRGLFCDLY